MARILPAAATALTSVLLLLPSTVSAVPAPAAEVAARQQVAQPLPSAWISVDATGGAIATITPSLTTVNGAVSTLSPPPEQLTRTQTWLMTVDGKVTTSTASAPVASATGSDGSEAGVVLVCDNYVGPDKPFCQPKRGSLLNPGMTYYITWDPDYFADPNTMVGVQVNYDGGHGFESEEKFRASVGFYSWTVPKNILEIRGQSTMNATVYLDQDINDGSQNNEVRIPGPKIVVTKEKMLLNDGLSHSTGPGLGVMVAVPIIVVAVVLGLLGFCFWSWRKRGVVPGAAAVAALKRRSTGAGAGAGGHGYGVRKNRSERVGGLPQNNTHHQQHGDGRLPDDKLPGIQLTDRDSWSPTSPSSGGRNVFREEIQRQETGGRR